MQTEKVTCLTCAGKGFVARHHITNKRNKTQCPTCLGEGEVDKAIVEIKKK
jgi:DnaJ-class molecular chaperone